MALVKLEIHSRRPYHGGAEFGATGAYERIDALAHFAVDPLHAANREIVDLDKAERDAEGRVLFSADFCLLQPLDPARGNGSLLLDVVNRGRRGAHHRFNRTPQPAQPAERIGPGDGFLMRRGWSIVWCGWQWDVLRSPGLMGFDAPQALGGGRPIQGEVLIEFQPNAGCADHLLADRIHTPYPAADVDDPKAVMRVRDWPGGPATVIPRQRWRFARSTPNHGGRPAADGSRVWVEGGFEPGRIYDVCYRTSICPVAGAGLLALRDAAAFLRHGDAGSDNPAAGRIARTYAFGASQCGRLLRHFLYLGLNVDEQGRQVFDGMIPHIAGARRGEFNQRFAQPSRQQVPGFGHLPPFAFDAQSDPVDGRVEGVLARQRAAGGVPRIIAVNTAAEYWRGDGSLLHTDMAGGVDVEPPPGVRVYSLAGTQHSSGSLPLVRTSAADGAQGVLGFNAVDYTPVLRAALDNLDRWVRDGQEPPPSLYPSLASRTAVPRSEVLRVFQALPAVALPQPERLRSLHRLDLGPDPEQGIARYPAQEGEAFPSYVSAVDRDGNEVAGIRLPDIGVPVATYTGWNPRDPATGGAGQILDMMGSTLPFPATAEERRRTADPRPAIDERYRGRDDYLARVREAAQALAAQRYVLAEDVDLLVQLAGEKYNAFVAAREAASAPADGS